MRKIRQVAIFSPSNPGYIIWGDHDTALLNALFTKLMAHDIYSLHLPSTALASWYENKRYRDHDGAIIISPPRFPMECQPIFPRLLRRIPCVSLMDPFSGHGGNAVLTDDTAAIRSLIDHLAGTGCRRIGFLSAVVYPWVMERFRAYHSCISSHGLSYKLEWSPGFTPEKGALPAHIREAKLLRGHSAVNNAALYIAERLIGCRERPDAVVCINDIHACRMIDAARKVKLRVPEDIAVTGFDNSRILGPLGINRYYRILTSVDRDPEATGIAAVKMLRSIVAGELPRNGNTIRITPTLVVRRSSLKRTSLLHHAATDNFKRQVLGYIAQHGSNRNALKDIARPFGMTHSYFLVRFRREFGTAFGAYFRREQLKRTARLLATTSRSIAAIARDAGLGGYQNFVKQFVKTYGISPREYRQNNSPRA